MADVTITFQELIQIMNGVDENNNPLTAASLTEERPLKNNKSFETINSISFEGGVFKINASGGCIVVEVEFPKTMIYKYTQIIRECQSWFDNINNPKYDNRILTLTLVPLIAQGQLTVLLDNLVYFFGVKLDKTEKVILCFDNNKTQIYQTEDINFAQIKVNVDKELKRQEDELNQELDDIEQEIKDIESKNVFDESIAKTIENPASDLLSTNDLYNNEEEQETNTEIDEDEFMNNGYLDEEYEDIHEDGLKTTRDGSGLHVDSLNDIGIRIARDEDE